MKKAAGEERRVAFFGETATVCRISPAGWRSRKFVGLLYDHRAGQCREYELAEGRVHYHRREAGGFALTVTARGSGAAVTITVAAD